MLRVVYANYRNQTVRFVDSDHDEDPADADRRPDADRHDPRSRSTCAALESELRSGIKGEVRFSAGDRGMYASDAGNYRMVPIGVVLPRMPTM